MDTPGRQERGGLTATRPITDTAGLSWLTTVRWTTLVAAAGAVLAARTALQIPVPIASMIVWFALWFASNVWLMWCVSRTSADSLVTIAGLLVCADVLLLSWILLRSGGVLNPASVFYLAEIVVAALAFGRQWTWIVTALCVGGYATLYLQPTDELRAALGMHREIALHMRGMWIAFSVTALVIAILVTRLVSVVEQRDRALDRLRERAARSARAEGLATLAAGAAHELSTPLSTIAVTAHELERNLAAQHSNLQADAELIRAETDRCRQVLEAMAVRSGEPAGETPRASTLADLVTALRDRLTPAEWNRLDVDLPDQLAVVWPIRVVVRALGNIVQNALQASPASSQVRVSGAVHDGLVQLQVVDEGTGMSADQLSRAGEPFFTTKPAGKGTGLGLFVARSSIEQLGGTLALAASPGRGTTASIVLPANVVTSEPERHA